MLSFTRSLLLHAEVKMVTLAGKTSCKLPKVEKREAVQARSRGRPAIGAWSKGMGEMLGRQQVRRRQEAEDHTPTRKERWKTQQTRSLQKGRDGCGEKLIWAKESLFAGCGAESAQVIRFWAERSQSQGEMVGGGRDLMNRAGLVERTRLGALLITGLEAGTSGRANGGGGRRRLVFLVPSGLLGRLAFSLPAPAGRCQV